MGRWPSETRGHTSSQRQGADIGDRPHMAKQGMGSMGAVKEQNKEPAPGSLGTLSCTVPPHSHPVSDLCPVHQLRHTTHHVWDGTIPDHRATKECLWDFILVLQTSHLRK